MEVVQFTGPFESGDEVSTEIRYDYTVVHIGVQIPQKQPIRYVRDKAYDGDLMINGKSYAVNENGILEFDGTTEIEFKLEFTKKLPPETIIDIVYKSTEE